MKPKVKKLLLEALRSGKYKQTTGKLRQGDSFCCLGVICDLHRKSTKSSKNKWDNNHYLCGKFEKGAYTLPSLVQKWAGLNTEMGNFKLKNGQKRSLADLNDGGKSFKQIANYIEKYF